MALEFEHLLYKAKCLGYSRKAPINNLLIDNEDWLIASGLNLHGPQWKFAAYFSHIFRRPSWNHHSLSIGPICPFGFLGFILRPPTCSQRNRVHFWYADKLPRYSLLFWAVLNGKVKHVYGVCIIPIESRGEEEGCRGISRSTSKSFWRYEQFYSLLPISHCTPRGRDYEWGIFLPRLAPRK